MVRCEPPGKLLSRNLRGCRGTLTGGRRARSELTTPGPMTAHAGALSRQIEAPGSSLTERLAAAPADRHKDLASGT